MLKKMICFLMACSCTVMPSVGLADEPGGDNTVSHEERTDILEEFIFEVNNKKVVIQDDKHVVVSFDITNPTADYYPELYYIPSLYVLMNEGEYYSSQKYLEYESVEFDLYANETRKITYDLKFPSRLPNMRYAVGIEFAVKEHTLSLADEFIYLNNVETDYNGFLVSTSAECVRVNENFYSSKQGPTITTNDNINAIISLRSDFSAEKKFIPEYSIYKRIITSNPIPLQKKYGEPITFKPGEEKEITLPLEIMKWPESYITKITFLDENMNRISGLYEFRYVVGGVSANISAIKAYQNENAVNVKVTLMGPADGTKLKDAEVICEIFDGEVKIGEKVIKTELSSVLYDADILLNSINIDRNTTALLKVTVKYGGKVLVEKNQEIKLAGTNSNEERLTDIKGTKYEEAVTVLNTLGILNGYPDGTFRPNNTITRAEFATIAAKLGEINVALEQESRFSDVVNEHWAKNFINACAENGVVSGYADGTFKPDSNVKYSESITMLLNLLGYKVSVNNSSLKWPSNYIEKSLEIGIHNSGDFLDYSLPATRGDIAILTYNAYLRR